MKMPRDRNDRVILVTASALVGLGLVVGLSNVTITAPATADAGATRPEVFRAQSARGPVPQTKRRPRGKSTLQAAI